MGKGEGAEIGSNGFDEGERGSLTLVIALVVGGKLGEWGSAGNAPGRIVPFSWTSEFFPEGGFEQLDKLPRYGGSPVAFRDVRNP